jgi:FAD/FMN-containing dehydrogenase
MPATEFSDRFVEAVHAPGVRMAYGRLSLAKGAFLTDSLLTTFKPVAPQPSHLPIASGASLSDGLTRTLFRDQTGSDTGKQLRWWAETNLSGLESSRATRNSIMNTSVRSFAGSDFNRTDILHEYFVPPTALETFLRDCRRIIPASDQDLLNLTLRWVEADTVSLLAFAPEPRIALVMFFSQLMTAGAEADMRRLTERLIDAALAAGGSFYLPYRLHARPDQVLKAYPRLAAFVEAKRQWDPQLRFRNQMWDRYFGAI